MFSYWDATAAKASAGLIMVFAVSAHAVCRAAAAASTGYITSAGKAAGRP